jgi:hypothetical protein
MTITPPALRHGAIIVVLSLALVPCGGPSGAAQSRFDKLTEPDRQLFSKRFEKDIWPLMMRGDKDGCVGCHSSGKIVSSLRFKGNDADKAFRMLLKDGYLLPDDLGGVLHLISTKNKKERMPKDLPAWPAGDVATMRQFILDLDKKQQK